MATTSLFFLLSRWQMSDFRSGVMALHVNLLWTTVGLSFCTFNDYVSVTEVIPGPLGESRGSQVHFNESFDILDDYSPRYWPGYVWLYFR